MGFLFKKWLASIALCLIAGGCQRGTTNDGKGLPENLIAQWRAAVGEPGWMIAKHSMAQNDLESVSEDEWLTFNVRLPASQESWLPGFRVVHRESFFGDNLAEPKGRFGLVFNEITDIELFKIVASKKLERLAILKLDGSDVTDDGLKELAGLVELEALGLRKTKVSDQGMENLAKLKCLRTLNLRGTTVTDHGIAWLADLPQLVALNLARTDVTGIGLVTHRQLQVLDLTAAPVSTEGIKQIARLSGLRSLNLADTEVTDLSLQELAALAELRLLNVSGTKVTEEGIQKLKEYLPELEIRFSPR